MTAGRVGFGRLDVGGLVVGGLDVGGLSGGGLSGSGGSAGGVPLQVASEQLVATEPDNYSHQRLSGASRLPIL